MTGEPDAGDPHVRFGGRGRANHSLPTPIRLYSNLSSHMDRRDFPTPLGDLSRAYSAAARPEFVLSSIGEISREIRNICSPEPVEGAKDDWGFPHTPTRPYEAKCGALEKRVTNE
ncbi:MAG: hypothetical protein WBD99_16105 [Thermodesulfobacteriota bacterium]